MASTRRISAALACALASCAPEASGPSAAPRGPAQRVILVTCDTLRADRLGAYGYTRPTSPNVDAFAKEGVVFERAYTTIPITGPALSSMLSCKLPEELGLGGGNRFLMESGVTTWPEILRRHGVATAAIVSNWVLRRAAATQGDVGVQQGFEHFDDRMQEREGERESFERRAPATTDAAIAWLESRRAAGDVPFALWVHYQDPHGPYTPPEEMLAGLERPRTNEAELPLGTTRSGKGQIPHYQVVGGERAPESYRERYDGEIRTFDAHFGRLIAWLKEHDWYDDALVVLSADHGESLGEHGYWFCHGENVHEEQVRVPLIVKLPRRATPRAGERAHELASLLDIGPTVLAALGVAERMPRGTSLLASAQLGARVVSQVVGQPGSSARWLGASAGRWRLIQEGKGAPQLFDLSADPNEAHDLAGAQPEVARELARRMELFLAERTGPVHAPVTMAPTSENQRALDQTGYGGGDEH